MDLKKLVEDNRERILELAAKHGASNVRLFGSVARGEATDRSDIDFLVTFSKDLRGFDYFGHYGDLMDDLKELLGVEVDVVDETAVPSEERPFIMREARPL